ncbi:hypothetical protein CNEO2_200044 [Clostridium neonatale]|uniref:Uncharacterized protein n=1 Tax=Clostridium neonatale TaxID=137838 RepID=A0AAD1YGF9_9CLOT|nr:hypothetical protein CNEO2_110031 [Clostridium neonatale]CAI3199369.1 hypothetical protein CNEO2_230037 [Clostridium neonatale]CAI3200862.1 hypothetical protein CNEO2_220045 [Clostridium neonatale]CAI3227740.1 hypothetical protein CNEO2_160033 [Clostridium neonatale]CAI3236432.1 hypothetical protein CNEO2_230022 [Clostridium neonatale]
MLIYWEFEEFIQFKFIKIKLAKSIIVILHLNKFLFYIKLMLVKNHNLKALAYNT